jgi:hypothetical protein
MASYKDLAGTETGEPFLYALEDTICSTLKSLLETIMNLDIL